MRVVEEWEISSIFLNVLLKFGDQAQVFEESSGFRQGCQQPDGSFGMWKPALRHSIDVPDPKYVLWLPPEICYQLMYVEPSGRLSPRDPWSYRQTGVEHKYFSQSNRNSIILLNPKAESRAENRFEQHACSVERHALAMHPMHTHLVIVSVYMTYWQEYLESLAASLQDIVRPSVLF